MEILFSPKINKIGNSTFQKNVLRI